MSCHYLDKFILQHEERKKYYDVILPKTVGILNNIFTDDLVYAILSYLDDYDKETVMFREMFQYGYFRREVISFKFDEFLEALFEHSLFGEIVSNKKMISLYPMIYVNLLIKEKPINYKLLIENTMRRGPIRYIKIKGNTIELYYPGSIFYFKKII